MLAACWAHALISSTRKPSGLLLVAAGRGQAEWSTERFARDAITVAVDAYIGYLVAWRTVRRPASRWVVVRRQHGLVGRLWLAEVRLLNHIGSGLGLGAAQREARRGAA